MFVSSSVQNKQNNVYFTVWTFVARTGTKVRSKLGISNPEHNCLNHALSRNLLTNSSTSQTHPISSIIYGSMVIRYSNGSAYHRAGA